ncbi:MAG: hypothetical protein GY940_02175 [bacterium]|nr:hypothetical protein [bacterium]
MPLQELSVKIPESVRFPEGIDREDLLLHLIAWYFYSSGNNQSAVELIGESPIELENKLLEFGFSRKWLTRMDSDKIRKKAEALEIVKEADALTEQRIKEGWEEDNFKQDFLRVQKEIAEIIKKKGNE